MSTLTTVAVGGKPGAGAELSALYRQLHGNDAVQDTESSAIINGRTLAFGGEDLAPGSAATTNARFLLRETG